MKRKKVSRISGLNGIQCNGEALTKNPITIVIGFFIVPEAGLEPARGLSLTGF